MNGYPYSSQPYADGTSNGGGLMDLGGGDMSAYGPGSIEGQSLDDIVSQNDSVNRRRSMPVYARQPQQPHQQPHQQPIIQMTSPTRSLSIMNFGDPNGGSLDDFAFDMSASGMEQMMRSNTFPRPTADMQPGADLAVKTQFSNAASPFSTMAAPGSNYASPIHASADLDMGMSPYPNGMNMSLDMDDSLNSMMQSDMNMFGNNHFNPQMMDSPVNINPTPINPGTDFIGPLPAPRRASNMNCGHFKSPSMSNTPDGRSGPSLPSRQNSHGQQDQSRSSREQSQHGQRPDTSNANSATQLSLSSLENQRPIAQDPTENISHDNLEHIKNKKLPWQEGPGGFPSLMHPKPHTEIQFKNAYSSSGFDMLGVLMRVATRPNPQIDIGSVDLSCAFVVCDADMDDIPIVYCSENFERLTGYTRHMILGRNCRFLQSPDGKVEAGIKRNYVDDDSVLYLKNTISAVTEAQISLINYRRGGQPFMNLLTMIPISWEPGGKVKFFVGFQVDLVEQPGAMTNKNSDGSYRVNYQRGMGMPSYVFNDASKPQPEQGQTISKDEVSNVLASYSGSGDSEITRRIWDKVLLENTDDVVHVLSLKGLFMYLSPSSNRILEYDPSELVGTALSSVCHPSDIVPVTRELKETTNGGSVNVVFRIRRKKSGYMWFEGHGSLHTEQGKGRKCIILVGRERPVYTLSKSIVRESGGIGDNELWTKMSTSGMFLFVSSNVRQLLDRQPEELVGMSMQSLMRQDSKMNFGRILELVRGGRKGEVKHEMINKRGQVLQAFTTMYPGDATEGHKPTFIVGQTRLLKYSRNSNGQRPSIYQTKEQNLQSSVQPRLSSASSMPGSISGAGSMVASPNPHFNTTEAHGTTFAGHNGLTIGHQDQSLASDDNVFDELKTTRSTSWQYELRQMEKRNRYLAEEVQSLLAAKKKRKCRKGAGQMQKDCANCHTRTTPEWRRGPSGNRDLCNSCGLRWAKQQGRVSPRTSSAASDKSKKSNTSPRHMQNVQSIMPHTIPETGQPFSVKTTLTPSSKRTPGNAEIDDHHAAKHARAEVAVSQGFVPPPKIDEE
ncbi:white collar-1 transcript variant 2 [Didymella exigua CBS 183.55]|uniref:White collar-1 transcript variant 2 n=1 Tax=Didymella exigua CBS 183.55 TaxID=1150837 RepID=A0A6A5RKQ6_9PLEO|nr:white collar-1 transcript variant 2 [Didymella exigua CBS 183.55]KAF1928985.1 white collar-1 transcript variant 2 [Didymella exigua CBS 183.55]